MLKSEECYTSGLLYEATRDLTFANASSFHEPRQREQRGARDGYGLTTAKPPLALNCDTKVRGFAFCWRVERDLTAASISLPAICFRSRE